MWITQALDIKSNSLMIAAALCLATGGPARASEGGWTSGGGDPLRILFEEGQLLASEILLKTEDLAFPANITPDVAAWVMSRRQELAQDIRASTLEWTIDPIEDQPTCALTEFRRSAPIKLSLLSCRGISSKEEAAKLLIHEATHHLGNQDETLADRVAVAVFATWGSQLNSDIATCPTPRDKDHPMVQMIRDLPGLWHRNREVSDELGIDRDSAEGPRGYVHFTQDPRVLAQFQKRPTGHCAFSAGVFKVFNRRGTYEAPYVAAEVDGRPTLFALPNRRFGIQIVRGQTREQDLLFLTDLDTREAVSAYAKGLREDPVQPGTPPRRPGPRPR